MRRALWVVAAMFAAVMTFNLGYADSSSCNGGTAAPAGGISVKNVGPNGTPPDATSGSLTVCNKGEVPLHGSLKVDGTINGQSSKGYVDVDGDSNNTQPAGGSCSDGFFRVHMDGSGPKFYQDPNGHYDTDRSTAPGVQRKAPESPDAWAQNIAHNCSGQ